MSRIGRIRAALDWRTFAVVGFLLTVILVGYLVVTSAQTAHQALARQAATSASARRRIDLLQKELAREQAALQAGAEDRGQLRSDVDALRAQVGQLGGTPVVTVRSEPTAAAAPRSTPSPSPKPTPRPTHSKTPTPRPSPTPSPTCTRLPVLGICRP